MGVNAETPLAFPNMCWLWRMAPPILSLSVSNQQRVGNSCIMTCRATHPVVDSSQDLRRNDP